MKANNTCSTATDRGLKPSKQIFKTPGTVQSSPVNCEKLILQLYPIDRSIRDILEKNNHNPYLELTLTSQKKISSIVKHLKEKWGDTLNFSNGEILLFPYNAKPNNLIGLKKWGLNDKYVTAADVYFILNSPSKFRLRYGWFSKIESATNERSPPHHGQNFNFRENLSDISNFAGKHQDLPPTNNNNNVSWLDSISNMSFGAILSKAEANNPIKNMNTLTSDSFDADIGALIAANNKNIDALIAANNVNNNDNNNNNVGALIAANNRSIDTLIAANNINNNSCNNTNKSIWDAEETCHAFSVQAPPKQVRANLQIETENEVETNKKEKKNDAMPPKEESNLLAKLDFSWTESMGAFENAIPKSKPSGFSENAALGGLISSSLDSFQKFLHF